MSKEVNSFLTEQIAAAKADQNPNASQETTTDENSTETTTVETPVTSEVEAATETTIAETTTTEVAAQAQEPTPSKIKVEYSEWLETNRGLIQEYLNHKDKDYTTLTNEEAVALKLKRENPYFNKQDIEAELADKYGIGLQKVVINRDDMDAEEIKEAEKQNALIDRGQRILKGEGEKAKRELEEYKTGLTLPEFEYEVASSGTVAKVATQEELQKQAKEYRDNVWVPELNKAVVEVPSIKKTITFEDNGSEVTLEVDVALDQEAQANLVSYLSNYVPQQSDSKYVKEDGSTDIKSFLAEKAEGVFIDKIIKQAVSQAYVQARKGVVKNELLNFDNGVTSTSATGSVEKSKQERAEEAFFKM